MLILDNPIEDTLRAFTALRDINLRDYEDTQDAYFKGKVDAYNLVIKHMEVLADAKTTE